jgi:hypothetical protein
MGLAVTVGILADLNENDPESVDYIRDDFTAINNALAKAKLPSHIEPESLPPLDDRTPVLGFPYSCLHQLRRVYAHHVASGTLAPPVDPDTEAEDPIIERVSGPRHHLLWHSDCEGYYIPIDFPEVIEGEDLPGGGFGSSQRLLAELQQIAELLGIRLEAGQLPDSEAERISALIDEGSNAYETEIMVWIALYEAARLSIEHRTAIQFA